ncbi:hypothetical protein PFISCL1PPCAC_14546, partial [Pristionchus fissidentatus]
LPILLISLVYIASTTAKYPDFESKQDVGDLMESFNGLSDIEGRYHPHHHRHRFPYPPFLRNVTYKARREFFRIVHDFTATKGEIKKRAWEWAIKNHVEAQVKAYHDMIVKFYTEHHKNVNEAIGQLQQAYDKVVEIFKDDSLTRHDTFVKIHDLIVKYPRELRYLLFATRPQPYHHRENEEEEENEDEESGYGPLRSGTERFRGFGTVKQTNGRLTSNRVEK